MALTVQDRQDTYLGLQWTTGKNLYTPYTSPV